MPLYEYQCESCAKRFERIQKFSDPPIDSCPSCGARVRKLLSSPAIQFKGSGWYITDYASKKPAAEGGAKADGSKPAPDSASSTSPSTQPASDTSTKTDTSTKSDTPAKKD